MTTSWHRQQTEKKLKLYIKGKKNCQPIANQKINATGTKRKSQVIPLSRSQKWEKGH